MRYWKIVILCLLVLATAFACTDDDHSSADDDLATDDDSTDDDNDTIDDDTFDDDSSDDDSTDDDDTDDDDTGDDDTIDDDTGDDDVVFTPLSNVVSERIDGGNLYYYQWDALALTADDRIVAATMRGHELLVFDQAAKGFAVQSVMSEVGQPIMAVGPDGDIHLLLLALDPYRVLYTRRTGDEWTTQTLIDGYRSHETLALAIEPDGDPVVAYTTYSTNKSSFGVNLATWNGSGFDVQTVGTWEKNDPVVKLAVDGDGFHHLAVLIHNHPDVSLDYLTDRSGAFVTTSLTENMEWSDDIFVTASATGRATVVFVDRVDNDDRLTAVFIENGNVTTTAVEDPVYVVLPFSLGKDAEDRPLLLYMINGEYRTAVWDGAAWTPTAITMPLALSAAKFDSTGALHLLGDIDKYDLHYATNAAGDWATELLDAPGHIDDNTLVSAAKDGQDNLCVVYHRLDDDMVCIATSGDKGWNIEEVVQLETGPYQTAYPRLAIDDSGARHLLYHTYDNHLVYATDAAGDWQFTTFDDSGLAMVGDLVVDSDGAVHIAVGKAYDLYYGTNGSGEWEWTTLGANVEAHYCDIVLDSLDRPIVSFYSFWIDIYGYYSESGLFWLDGSWQYEPLTVMDFSPHYLAIHNDVLSTVSQSDEYGLVFKQKDAGVWSEENLQTGGSFALTIAADRLGRLGIAYYDAGSPDQLEYLQRDDAGWRYFIVDQLQAQRTAGTLLYTADDTVHLFTVGLGALYHTSFPRPE